MALRLISDSMSPKAEGGLVNNSGTIGTLLWDLTIAYTPKNHQPVAMLLRTGLNKVVLPHCSRLSTMVNNIVIRHSASTTLFNIVDNYKQVGSTWAAQHCSILLNCRLMIFCRVAYDLCINIRYD